MTRSLTTITFASTLVLCGLRAQAPPERGAVRMSEELCIVYAVHDVYRHWPSPALPVAMPDQIAAKRLQLAGLSARAWELSASEVAILVDQTEKMLDLFEGFLRGNPIIEQAVAEQRQRAGDSFFYNFIIKDAVAHATKAGPWGVALATVVGLADLAISSSGLAKAEATLLRERQTFIESELHSRYDYFANTIAMLAKKRGWSQGAIDFSPDCVRRSDPYQAIATARALSESASAAEQLIAAAALARSAKLAPANGAFDSLRQLCWPLCSSIAARAASSEWFATEHGFGGPVAKRAIDLCRARLAGSSDSDDAGKYELAQCLHFAGRHAEALEWAMRAEGQNRNPSYAYDLACVLSANERYAESLTWLERSFALGQSNTDWAREGDPDLAGLRSALPAQFAALFEVKWSWSLDRGSYWHDVIIYNHSRIPLTSVEFEPSIARNWLIGTASGHTQRKLPYLGPGAFHRFEDAFVDWPIAPTSATLVSTESRGTMTRAGFVLGSRNSILVHNKTQNPVRIAVRYQDTQEQWQLVAWWSFAPGEQAFLLHDHIRILTDCTSVLFYAESTDGSKLVWEGDGSDTGTISGTDYKLRRCADESGGAEIVLTK